MFKKNARSTLARLTAEAAAHKRLDVVTGRGKVEESFYPQVEELPLKTPPIVKRRFWNPDELMAVR